jgi:hypothetical protein
MWTTPVARMTPAPKALSTKNGALFLSKARQRCRSRGRNTPSAEPMAMMKMAATRRSSAPLGGGKRAGGDELGALECDDARGEAVVVAAVGALRSSGREKLRGVIVSGVIVGSHLACVVGGLGSAGGGKRGWWRWLSEKF